MNAKTIKPRTSLASHADDLSDAAQSIVADLKTEASSRLKDVKKKAGSHLAEAQDTASDAMNELKDFIKEHPFTAVGIGLAAGLLIAALARKS